MDARPVAADPIIRFDGSVATAPRLVPRFGDEQAERIMFDAASAHRRVDDVTRDRSPLAA